MGNLMLRLAGGSFLGLAAIIFATGHNTIQETDIQEDIIKSVAYVGWSVSAILVAGAGGYLIKESIGKRDPDYKDFK